jgi:hypothetical protein
MDEPSTIEECLQNLDGRVLPEVRERWPGVVQSAELREVADLVRGGSLPELGRGWGPALTSAVWPEMGGLPRFAGRQRTATVPLRVP